MSEATETIEARNTAMARAEPRRVPSYVLPLIIATVVAIDAVLATAAFVGAFLLRADEAVLSATAWAWSPEFVPYAGILYFAIIIRVAMTAYQRLYRFQGAFSYSQEAIRVFKAVAVGSLLIVAWAFLFRGGFAFREFSYSRAVFVIDFGLALVLFTAFHLFIRWLQAVFRRRDINLLPTLIVGTGPEAEQTIEELRRRPDLGYRVVGVVTSVLDERETFAGTANVGTFDQLPSLVRDLGIQEVIITDSSLKGNRLFEAMMGIGRKQRVEFRFAPSLFDLLPQKTSVEQIGILPMVRLFREPLSDIERFIKRASDIVLATVSIILLAPVFFVIALIIRTGSKGPILFRQERVGMDGRIFLCLKFRTMVADADEAIHLESYKKNISGEADANAGDDDEPVFGKVKDDPRVTSAGRWLRRSSLDELPQLLNVLKGDMSIVGPRPPIPYEVVEYRPWHRKRLDMKPGITGLWQVSGRSRLTFEEMVRIDVYYIENWSLWFDLKIILLTLPAIFRGDGAR